MVRVLFEISLPHDTVDSVRSTLAPETLAAGIVGRLEMDERGGGCQSPARGGEAAWTPCWISVEGQHVDASSLAGPLHRLREAVVAAARRGGLQLYAIPATAQIGEEFRRYPDLLDVLADLG